MSLRSARRIALAAQGFGRARPLEVRSANLRRVVERLGLHQIDSVNVLARAHYLPAFARLGIYDRGLLDRAAWGKPRRLFEYWAHEASLLPVAMHPLLRWRMQQAERGEVGWGRLRAYATERRAEAEAVLARIRDEGALAASDFEQGRSRAGWWEWGDSKSALEFLFWAGLVTTSTRRGSFERVYDLPERVLPGAVLDAPTPGAADAQRALLAIAARALGVATAGDLRDYFRLSPQEAYPRLEELVEEGTLVAVTVEGWSRGAYLHREARMPRRVRGQALLAPFDPLIWDRGRTQRLFDTRYRIEIYTPAAKRVHGYYVLPFLLDEAIVARVDLKADRQNRALLVQAAHAESGAPEQTAERLAAELQLMARWLELDRVVVAGRGSLAAALAGWIGGREAA